jgi:hypothetical protein
MSTGGKSYRGGGREGKEEEVTKKKEAEKERKSREEYKTEGVNEYRREEL